MTTSARCTMYEFAETRCEAETAIRRADVVIGPYEWAARILGISTKNH